MGVCSMSISGNDTAQDLKDEYAAAFFYYDVETALKKIDSYVRREMFDEFDEEEWCNYYYSLADYMWKKGILNDTVRDEAVRMIDSEFGLELWADEGKRVLEKRKKILAEFKAKLCSPQPPKKKIKINANVNKIFNPGDIVAIQLQTKGKPYTGSNTHALSEEEFHALDEKYILMQLIECYSSRSSSIVPEINDYWAKFILFNGIYDEAPTELDASTLTKAAFHTHRSYTPEFTCESKMIYFKRRNFKLIGNFKIDYVPSEASPNLVFLSVNTPYSNPDSELIDAILNNG